MIITLTTTGEPRNLITAATKKDIWATEEYAIIIFISVWRRQIRELNTPPQHPQEEIYSVRVDSQNNGAN